MTAEAPHILLVSVMRTHESSADTMVTAPEGSGSLAQQLVPAVPGRTSGRVSPRPRSRTPSIDGPRLSFSSVSRGELPVVVFPDRDRRQILFAAYGVLFTRYNIATFLSAFFGSAETLCADDGTCMSGTWQGLIFAAYPLGMALTSLFASQVGAVPSPPPVRPAYAP